MLLFNQATRQAIVDGMSLLEAAEAFMETIDHEWVDTLNGYPFLAGQVETARRIHQLTCPDVHDETFDVWIQTAFFSVVNVRDFMEYIQPIKPTKQGA